MIDLIEWCKRQNIEVTYPTLHAHLEIYIKKIRYNYKDTIIKKLTIIKKIRYKNKDNVQEFLFHQFWWS